MESNKYRVSASPHIVSAVNTRLIMICVCVALLPTLIAATVIFGLQVLLLCGVTVAACVGFEALYCVVMKKPVPVGDFSAVVTGLILAFNLPPGFPLWMAVIGAFISIVIVKQLFGGIGLNFANPALVGRMVLQLSFTGEMINYTYPQNGVDVLAGATPLYAMQNGPVPLLDLVLGTHGGVLGETCALALVLGGLFMIFTKVISPIVPAFYVGGVYVFKLALLLLGGQSAGFGDAALSSFIYILGGGLMLGAFFMATDYTTCPYTRSGKMVYGILLAIITVAIREWATMLEGVSYALLLMNLLVPYINGLCRQRPMGVKKAKKAGKEAA